MLPFGATFELSGGKGDLFRMFLAARRLCVKLFVRSLMKSALKTEKKGSGLKIAELSFKSSVQRDGTGR